MDPSVTPFHLIPDCVREIISHLHSNHKALFSCALVNRLWCRSAIPLLWCDIFNGNYLSPDKGTKIISIYMSCLTEIQRKTLINHNLNLQENFKPALFDYPKYLRFLNCRYFDNALYSWCKATIKPDVENTEFQKTLLICNHIISQYILSHSAGLYTLHLNNHNDNGCCLMHLPPDVCVNGICHTFSKLTELQIDNGFQINSSQIFEKLSLHSHSIQKLYISVKSISDLVLQQEIFSHLFLLINSQHKLQSFTVILSWAINSQSSLFFSALTNQSHSLKFLEIGQLYDISILIPYLASFNLDTLKLIYYNTPLKQIDPRSIPYLHSRTQFKIKNLIIYGTYYSILCPFFSKIIKLSGSHLEKISFNGCDENLTNTIAEYSSNITSLSIIINYAIFNCFVKALSKLKKLKYLNLESAKNDIQYTKDMILKFAKIFPNSIEELNFNLTLEQEHIDAFLKELKVSLTKLTIYLNELDDEILNSVIDYAIRTGNLKEFCFNADVSFSHDVWLKAQEIIPVITDMTDDVDYNLAFYLFA
ncbi:3469_t:CDS:1 [Scutellospora calospora]|uniref:3469_t:CDS:1 n=1 Tax=Scutellospora calospora TaxID=85575 RepID=A0ACA9NE77_9GLOM|nr:3469_t:CDS:1 [Scutellospora calospora]